MARTAGGAEVAKQARACLRKAKTAEELRQAQAVLLPLEHGLSLAQTARAIGVSTGWASQLRQQFIQAGGAVVHKPGRGGRRRQNMTREEEAAFLQPFFDRARSGGILVVGEIKQALDRRLGRKVALGSAYNLLHRHGWRKLAPDTRHPQADPVAQADWKKNSPSLSPKSSRTGQARRRSG